MAREYPPPGEGSPPLTEHAAANRAMWNEDAPNWVERGRANWAAERPHWGRGTSGCSPGGRLIFPWPDDEGTDFHLPHGEMIGLLRRTGFEVEALQRWPAEEVWVARCEPA